MRRKKSPGNDKRAQAKACRNEHDVDKDDLDMTNGFLCYYRCYADNKYLSENQYNMNSWTTEYKWWNQKNNFQTEGTILIKFLYSIL